MEYQAASGEKVIYRLNQVGKILLAIGVLSIAISSIVSSKFLLEDWLNSTQSQDQFFASLQIGLLLLLIFALATTGIIVWMRQFLEVSVDGIVVCYGGPFKIYTPWENISGVKVGAYHPLSRGEEHTIVQFRQLPLKWVSIDEGKKRHVAFVEVSWWMPKIVKPAPLDKIFLSNHFLTFPYRDWQNSEFGLYMQQYASEAYQKSLES